VLASTREALCLYAVEPWLERFPGFVDNLALHLHGYATGLRTAKVAYAASLLKGEPADCHGSYWRLMTQVRSSHADREISDSDFQWYDARACLANWMCPGCLHLLS
jgi:hypothetical protein